MVTDNDRAYAIREIRKDEVELLKDFLYEAIFIPEGVTPPPRRDVYKRQEEGRKNLERAGWQVDFIVTHCTASSTQALAGGLLYHPDALTDYLEEIRQKCQYQRWFFGHYHDDRNVTERDLMLYEQIIRIR